MLKRNIMGFPSGNKCALDGCREKPVTYVLGVRQRRSEIERCYCVEHGSQFLADYDAQRKVFGVNGRSEPAEFDVELVVLDGNKDWHPIYLREVNGSGRCLRLYAGVFETSALYWRFKQPVFPRPLIHQIIPAIIRELGGELRDVLIYELTPEELAFRAYLRIAHVERLLCFDVRPSDAIHIATLADVPIHVPEDVLEVAAQTL
jgi:bifunctional DNase/RNase